MKTLVPADAGPIRRSHFTDLHQAELAEETMKLVSEIQHYRERTRQAFCNLPENL
jgi:hypothetical protein